MKDAMLEHWIATIDRGRGRLVRCTRERTGDWRLSEDAVLEGSELAWHEHQRPAMLGREADGRARLAAPPHEAEESRLRSARDAAAWLLKAAEARQIGEVDLFAPARLLHDLRGQWPQAWRDRIRDHDANLTKVPLSELASHPAVAAALGDFEKSRGR